MATNFYGAIVGVTSGGLYATIKPDEEAELANPAWLKITQYMFPTEVVRLVMVPRALYDGWTSFQQYLDWLATQ